MRTDEILVGTDGTAASGAAVRWAAREARRRRLLLRIAHVGAGEGQAAGYGAGAGHADVARPLEDPVAADARRLAREVAADIAIELDALVGDPAARLLAVSEDAALIVVGSRGRGGFASMLLGSVGQRIATHAPGPVVVVRGRGEATEGPVVAGVDDSPAAEHVLATAFDAASGRGAALTVVRAHSSPGPGDRLEDLLAPWRRKHPEVPVEAVVSPEDPAAVLVDLSRGAQLVVVGSRGHGTIAATLLGSTGLQVLHHADCPVLVARPRRREGLAG